MGSAAAAVAIPPAAVARPGFALPPGVAQMPASAHVDGLLPASAGTGAGDGVAPRCVAVPSRFTCWTLAIIAASLALIVSVIVNRVNSIGYVSDDAAYFAYAIETMRTDGSRPYVDFFVLHGPIYFWIGEFAGAIADTEIVTPVIGVAISLFLLVMVARCAIGMTVRSASRGRVSGSASASEGGRAGPRPTEGGTRTGGAVAASLDDRAVAGRSPDAPVEGPRAAPRSPMLPSERLMVTWPVLLAVGLVAASLVIGWGHLVAFVPSGGRPKFLAIGLILAATLALSRRWLMFGGILIGLACWTWQVAVFAGSALILFWIIRHTLIRQEAVTVAAPRSRHIMRHWRRTAFPWQGLVRIGGGLMLVCAGCVALLAAQGRLSAFFEHAVVFPFVYQVGPWEARDLPDVPAGLRPLIPWGLLTKYLSTSSPAILALVAIGLGGAIWVSVRRFREGETGPEVGLRWYVFGVVFGQHVQSAIISHGPGYVVAMLAPLSALAGWIVIMGVARPASRLRRGAPFAVLAVAAMMAAVFFINGRRPPEDAAEWQRRVEDARAIAVLAGSGGMPRSANGGAADSAQPTGPAEAMTAEVLPVGEPILRALIRGEPREFDVQWVFGRDAWLAAKWPGGQAAWAEQLLQRSPAVVVVSDRCATVESLLEDALRAGGYQPTIAATWEGRPVWVRGDLAGQVNGRQEDR